MAGSTSLCAAAPMVLSWVVAEEAVVVVEAMEEVEEDVKHSIVEEIRRTYNP